MRFPKLATEASYTGLHTFQLYTYRVTMEGLPGNIIARLAKNPDPCGFIPLAAEAVWGFPKIGDPNVVP